MSKYKVGDRVRIVDHRVCGMNPDGDMDKWFDKVMTIKTVFGESDYKMVEDYGEHCGDGWYWTDEMIAGLEHEPWTDEEIEKARQIVAYLADGIVYDGGDLRFISYDDDLISAAAWTDSFNAGTQKDGTSKPHGEDVYNPWIGKCVALCKAMGEPVPEFIMNKNRRQ